MQLKSSMTGNDWQNMQQSLKILRIHHRYCRIDTALETKPGHEILGMGRVCSAT